MTEDEFREPSAFGRATRAVLYLAVTAFATVGIGAAVYSYNAAEVAHRMERERLSGLVETASAISRIEERTNSISARLERIEQLLEQRFQWKGE